MTPGILNSQEVNSDFRPKMLNFKIGFTEPIIFKYNYILNIKVTRFNNKFLNVQNC